MREGRAALAVVGRALASRHVDSGRWRALMAFGPGALGYGPPWAELEFLLIADRYGPGIRCIRDRVAGRAALLIAADRRVMEEDVRKALVGDLLADKLLVPYVPLLGADYLRSLELQLKARLAHELLLDLVSNFPRFATELLLDPRYFLYETVARMGRLMPLSAYMFANVLARGRDRARYEPIIMHGFKRALRLLARDGWVELRDGLARPTAKLVKARRRTLISNVIWRLRGAIRSLGRYMTKAISGIARTYVLEKEVFHERLGVRAPVSPLSGLPRPEDFLLVRTSVGLRPALKEIAIRELAEALGPVGAEDDVLMTEIGGSLNVVYLVSVRSERGTTRFVLKRFRNWDNLKWLTIRFWALGAKRFAISGRERLKRELVMCRTLREAGFPVPRIFHVSLKENSLLEEFVEGANLGTLMKEFLFAETKSREVLGFLASTGELVARVHAAGFTIGDCKPENVIIGPDGRPNLVDLEQAAKGGDRAWDVAEFLYYSGHYVPSVASAEPFEQVARSFLKGYLEGGGDRDAVRKARSVRFARVFSIFTPAQVIEVIDRVCEEEAA